MKGFFLMGTIMFSIDLLLDLELSQSFQLLVVFFSLYPDRELLFSQLPEVLLKFSLHPVDFLGEPVDLWSQFYFVLHFFIKVLFEGEVLLLEFQLDQLMSLNCTVVLLHPRLHQLLRRSLWKLSFVQQLFLQHPDLQLKSAYWWTSLQQLHLLFWSIIPRTSGLFLRPAPQLLQLQLQILVSFGSLLNRPAQSLVFTLQLSFSWLRISGSLGVDFEFFLEVLFPGLGLIQWLCKGVVLGLSLFQSASDFVQQLLPFRFVLCPQLLLFEFEFEVGDIIPQRTVFMFKVLTLGLRVVKVLSEAFCFPLKLLLSEVVLFVETGHHEFAVLSQFLFVEVKPLHES